MNQNIVDADPSIIELLQDGDGRQKPSSIIEAQYESSEVIDRPMELAADAEERVKVEVEENLRKIIDYGAEAVKDLADLAHSSEHPRPYEAMSSLIKSVVDANMALLDVRKTPGAVLQKGKRTNEESPVQTKEDIMKASVGDLLNMIDRRRRQGQENGEIIDVDPNEE